MAKLAPFIASLSCEYRTCSKTEPKRMNRNASYNQTKPLVLELTKDNMPTRYALSRERQPTMTPATNSAAESIIPMIQQENMSSETLANRCTLVSIALGIGISELAVSSLLTDAIGFVS